MFICIYNKFVFGIRYQGSTGGQFLTGAGPGITKFDQGRAGDFLTDNFKTTKIVMNEIMAIFSQNLSNFIRQINFHFYQPVY